MIYGIGIDLVEIPRLRDMLERQPRLPERILSEKELARFNHFTHPQRKIEFLAGRFACKEAFSKALGTGIGKEIRLEDIHCENDELGKPTIQYEDFIVHVSITHTAHYAMSQVLLEK